MNEVVKKILSEKPTAEAIEDFIFLRFCHYVGISLFDSQACLEDPDIYDKTDDVAMRQIELDELRVNCVCYVSERLKAGALGGLVATNPEKIDAIVYDTANELYRLSNQRFNVNLPVEGDGDRETISRPDDQSSEKKGAMR